MIKPQKTKIVCTIGPVSESRAMLKKLILAGMDVARLNFSHGDYDEFSQIIKNIRELSKELNQPVAILQDLAGPKFRIGKIENELLVLKKGDEIVLSKKAGKNLIPINEPKLIDALKVDDIIFLDDGTKKIKVFKKQKDKIYCKVLVGGDLISHKGINVPGLKIKISALTHKDFKDLVFGISHNVDYVGLSFVRNVEDIKKLKEALGKTNTKIISKIETLQALKNLEDIIKETDGVMVARGDLGIEAPIAKLPTIQKNIVSISNNYGKPVVVATQMLKSMTDSPFPTRAEVNDVSNAILDGADAVMLSEETSTGKYPLEAVKIMNDVIRETEKILKEQPEKFSAEKNIEDEKLLSIASGIKEMVSKINPKAIVVFTESGRSAQIISSLRVSKTILALTPHLKTYNQLALLYGVFSFKIEQINSFDEMKKAAKKIVSSLRIARKNDKIIIVAGIPFAKSGGTNLIFIEKI